MDNWGRRNVWIQIAKEFNEITGLDFDHKRLSKRYVNQKRSIKPGKKSISEESISNYDSENLDEFEKSNNKKNQQHPLKKNQSENEFLGSLLGKIFL